MGQKKDNPLHIGYIGRLEYEKGADILVECIRQAEERHIDIEWHICGDGLYRDEIVDFPSVVYHGHVDHDGIRAVLETLDAVLMPSRFLETFGLVALESLSAGVPVIGFKKGGLVDFIPDALALHSTDPVESFFDIISQDHLPLVDVASYQYDNWKKQLQSIIGDHKKILILHDYSHPIGGAEVYIQGLMSTLSDLGVDTKLIAYLHHPSRLMRLWHVLTTPLAFWRRARVREMIDSYQPDMVWIHTVTRYIGIHGLKGLSDYIGDIVMMHHDLGLVSPRPSHIYDLSNIPETPSLGSWMHVSQGMIGALGTIYKWIIIQPLWNLLNTLVDRHLVPSEWMRPILARYTDTRVDIFAHSIPDQDHKKKEK